MMDMDAKRWLAHFQKNQLSRPEPDWESPITLSPVVVAKLVHSIEQFQLGDGGGPASLVAFDADKFRSLTPEHRTLVDLWFNEEKEHSRLLLGLVERFGGTPIEGHWSFHVFCGVRRWFGVRFELRALLLTEIVSTAYYRLLKRYGDDTALRGVCKLILRDEAGHVAFHRDRLARQSLAGKARYGSAWESHFRLLGLAAATMLWVNHRSGVTALGATTSEFYSEVWTELGRFISQLRADVDHLSTFDLLSPSEQFREV